MQVIKIFDTSYNEIRLKQLSTSTSTQLLSNRLLHPAKEFFHKHIPVRVNMYTQN